MSKNTRNKHLPLILMILAAVCVGVAILSFVLASKNSVAYRRVLMNICGVLLVVLAVLLLYFLYLTRDAEPNFFLYDQRLRRNIPVEKLSFPMVNAKMTNFLSFIAASDELLWRSDLLIQSDKFGYRGVYRPLVAYKMLFDLTERDKEENWAFFTGAGKNVIQLLCEALEQNGETEMTKALRHFHDTHAETERIRAFLVGNRRYMQSKMVAYVKRNLELFY